MKSRGPGSTSNVALPMKAGTLKTVPAWTLFGISVRYPSYTGVSVDAGSGWAMLRPSIQK